MCIMGRGKTLIARPLVWLLLGLVQLAILQRGADARMLATGEPKPLPPCDFPGAMPMWNCYDPPKEPLPPCDFNHQREGIDCSGWPPAVAHVSHEFHEAAVAGAGASPAKTQSGMLASTDWPRPLGPCNFPGAIPMWNCYDPPKEPLPPCDFKHQREGIDCSGWPPAVAHVSHEFHEAAVAGAGASPAKTQSGMLASTDWPRPLGPCNFPGAIPMWNCYDPPKEPLPPCDFKHQREGIDCSGWPPAVAHVSREFHHTAAADAGGPIATRSSTSGHGGIVTNDEPKPLPPCNFPDAMPMWNCYDPPKEPLPPCDFKHQREGFDCSTPP